MKITAAVVAFFLAFAGSAAFSVFTHDRNRAVEWDRAESSGSLSEAQLHWLVAHIRDDIGSIHNLIVITNGLLAALLAFMIF